MEARTHETLRPGQPVLHLQIMLRTIAFQHSTLPQVIPTGVFDEPTLEAVMTFQRDFHPPVTGVVDTGTWAAIVQLYRQALAETAVPLPCAGYPFGSLTIEPGTSSVHLPVIQAMFRALSEVLDGVEDGPVNGVHEGASVRNVCWLGQCDGCSGGGVITRDTWNYLSRLYRLFVAHMRTPNLTLQELLSAF